MTVQPLLAGHRDSEALLGADYVLLALAGLGGVDPHPADPSVELVAGGVVVVETGVPASDPTSVVSSPEDTSG